jgi:hypothetical protein
MHSEIVQRGAFIASLPESREKADPVSVEPR